MEGIEEKAGALKLEKPGIDDPMVFRIINTEQLGKAKKIEIICGIASRIYSGQNVTTNNGKPTNAMALQEFAVKAAVGVFKAVTREVENLD